MSLRRTLAAWCALALLLVTGEIARTDTIPNVQYLAATGHYYKVYTDTVSWKTAKANAEALGGYLAVVTSQTEDSFLSGTLGARDKWLGASDESTEGTWVWVNGETWQYTGWNTGEPNNSGNEDFLSYNSTGTWNDLPTSYNVGYIVEWDKDPNVTDPPPAPSGLSATATTETRVDLSWTDNSTIETAYEVERAVGGAAFGLLATLPENATSYADSTVLAGGDYSYRVRATNKIGPSAWTAEANVRTSTPPVSKLAVSVLSNRTIEATWQDDSPDDETIGVERGLGATPAAWSRIAEVAGDATSHIDTGVAPDTVYSYRLQPLRTVGGFAPSSAVSIKSSPADPVPGQPVVRDGTKVDLTWQDLSNSETSYEVERGLGSPGTDFHLIAVLGPDKTTYRDSTALPETTYSYRVRAVGPTGPSDWSPEIAVTTPPFAPSGFGIEIVSTSQAELSWTDASAIEDGYRVERKEKVEDRWIVIATLASGASSFTDAEVRQDTQYTWRVAAFDEHGDSAFATTPELGTPSALRIDRLSISRPKPSSRKPAKVLATGAFDAGVAAFAVATEAELRFGDATIALGNRKESKKGVQLDGDQFTLLLKPSKTSSRVSFVLTAVGDRAAAIEPGTMLRLWYRQAGFAASGAIVLQGDRFTAGSVGALADPPLTVDVFSGKLTNGAKDKLTMRCRFAAGPAPETAPPVSVQIGALRFSAPAAQFARQGEKWVFSQKVLGAQKVVLDYAKGVATFSIAGVELGAFTIDFDPGELLVKVGDLEFRDRLVLGVTKKTVGY